MKCRVAINKDIVFNFAITASANKGCSGYLVKQVAVNAGARKHIVQVDANATTSLKTINMMQEIMADNSSTHSPVPSAVNGTCIIRLITNMVNFVKFYQVVVSTKSNCHVGGVMNQVMGSTVTSTIERNCWLVDSVPAAIMLSLIHI